MLIERISKMIELRKLQRKYCDKQGNEPYNVSSWMASETYSNGMLCKLEVPKINTIDYIYTYSMDRHIVESVKEKIDPNIVGEMGITFTDNGTQAIVTLINLIKQYGYKKICIINPSYFSIAQALQAYGLSYDLINFKREGGKYVLPEEKLFSAKYDVIWITSPIFSTSVYFDVRTVEVIHQLMDMGTLVISDECFCVHGNELVRHIKNKENFIAIYSPHKSLCINTFKFAALIYPMRFDTFIEHWVDVLTGNLPASSLGAISHFIDPNFEECLSFYKEYMLQAYKSVQEIVNSYKNVISDEVRIGSLLTLYFENLTYEKIKSLSFMEEVICNTGFSFYPSFLNGLDESFGFAFRINLALYDNDFLTALDELLKYLSTY